MNTVLIEQDRAHRAQALDPHGSFIVQAPAGSGKTELIIQRYLMLLGQVKKPEEILAITFTKKAAHEMRARVTKALEHAAHQPEPSKAHEQLTWRLAKQVLKRDQQFNWHLLENPNQLHIKTIDSFCTYLTGQLPLLSHFGATPDIAIHAQALYREAVLEVLSHVEEDHPWSPAVAKLLAHIDNDLNRLALLLISLLEKRDQWQQYIIAETDAREILTEHLQAVVDERLAQVDELFPKVLRPELSALLQFALNNLAHSNSELLVLNETQQGLKAWRAIAEFLLTKENTWRKTVNESIGFPALKNLKGDELKEHRLVRARHKELTETLSQHENLRSTLEIIRKLPDPYYTDAQWSTLQALLEVLKITLAQCRVTFQTHGRIDFIENAWGASLALGNEQAPTDLALSLDYQIQHILVDEFQDTSFPQYRLLSMLTHGWQSGDGRTLFVVGDPMQSIYRFRQAEVGLFLRMQQQGLGAIQLTPLTLAVNFRSTAAIVDWNNQHFAAIFPGNSDIAMGAVHYSHSIANNPEQQNTSHIHIKGLLDGDAKAQAAHVINTIQQQLTEYPDDNIAILVRSRSHLSAIIPALKAAKLSYQALDIDPLIARQSVQDALALTRALLHPADRIAWLAILRAPWCGLTLSDLLKVTQGEYQGLIWEKLNHTATIANLSEDGQQRLRRITPILQAAINNRARESLRPWIENTWLALGGPATLPQYDEIQDINAYFDLLSEISQENPEIGLEILQERIEQLHASTHQTKASIQIMTVHSAKGLEFDTVILPHLEKFNPPDDKSLLLWMEQPLINDQTALLLAPIHAADSEADKLYRYIESTQRVKALYEVDRLLYVATTRAKKRLHLVFSKKDSESTSQRGSFLDKLWLILQNQISLEPVTETSIIQDYSVNPSARTLKRLPAQWLNPITLPTAREAASAQLHQGFKLPDQSRRLIGTVSHLIFQQFASEPKQRWESIPSTQQEQYIKRHLMQAGLTPHQHAAAIQHIMLLIKRALNDERGQWILAPHPEAKSELSLTVKNGDEFTQLIIDRTFVDEHGIRWIIDYKTAEVQDEELSIFLTKQKQKYATQMQQYQKAMQALDDRPIKMGLYFPAIPAWCEY